MWMALIIGLALGFFGSVPVAGPASILVLKSALEKGHRHGFDVAIGAAIGEAVYACVAFWGLTTILERFPVLVPISKIVGAMLVIALGIYLVLRRATPTSDRPSHGEIREDGGKTRRFVRGLLSAILNPTLLATWTTVVAGLHAASLVEQKPSAAIFFGLGVGLGILGWFAFLVKVIVQRFRKNLAPEGIQRAIRGFGWAMIAVGTLIASRALWKLPLT